jgi:hypothetical protein
MVCGIKPFIHLPLSYKISSCVNYRNSGLPGIPNHNYSTTILQNQLHNLICKESPFEIPGLGLKL